MAERTAKRRCDFLVASVIALGVAGAQAAGETPSPLHGARTVYMETAAGERQAVATMRYLKEWGDSEIYTLQWSDTAFNDEFLSMRPFKCLEGAEKMWCRVPYPYEIRRSVTTGDLTDLEYDLLFVWKDAGDYGIDMWNGVYYRLAADGDRLVGALHEMDMGLLAVPPVEGELRPIAEDDLHAGDPDSHWLPRVVVE